MILSRSDSPILTTEAAWEEDALLSAVTMLPEPDGSALRLYYLVRFGKDPTKNMLCLARSDNGRDWSRPDLGDGTNIVMRASGHVTGWGIFMPKRIVHDPADAKAPWKMIYWERPSERSPVGICLATSPDGIVWTQLGDQPLIDSANDAASFTPAHPSHAEPLRGGRYLLYQQTWRYNPALPQVRDNLKAMHRRISVWHNSAFNTTKMSGGWIGPITVLEEDTHDPADLQFYWLTPFHTSSGYGGLLNCHHTIDQTMDTQYVTSHDGWTWQRELNRQPILPLGDAGTFDCGMVFCTSPPLKWKGETLIIYNGRATVHDAASRYPDHPLPSPSQGVGLAVVSDLDILAAS